MSFKSKYYEVFGLTESATKSEVKRAYRKLAMKYHPDRNPDPKAHKLFLDLTEAYQIILDERPQQKSPFIQPKRKEKTTEERLREAKERLRNQTEQKKRYQENYLKKLTSGLKFKFFKYVATVATILTFILVLDQLLPSHFTKDEVVSYSKLYNGLEKDDVRMIKTKQGHRIFLDDPNPNMLFDSPEIIVESTFWMRNPIRVWYHQPFEFESFGVDFSIINLFPIVPLILLIPIFTWKFDKRNYGFIVLLNFSVYAISIFELVILISGNRWLHILTFGIV